MPSASGSASGRGVSPQLRSAQRFELAARDMQEAAAAASWLASNGVPHDVERVFMTGIAVTYARPFTHQDVGQIDRMKYAPADRDASRLHFMLIDLRDRIYAHTDQTNYRWIQEGVSDVLGFPSDLMGIPPGSAVEIVVEALVREELPAVAALAEAQAETFWNESDTIRAAAGASPSSRRRLTAGGNAPTVRIGDGTEETAEAEDDD